MAGMVGLATRFVAQYNTDVAPSPAAKFCGHPEGVVFRDPATKALCIPCLFAFRPSDSPLPWHETLACGRGYR